MTAYEIDTRQSEADREYALWVQRGAPPRVVRELLPMLVGTVATHRAASAWLSRNAIVGDDMSAEGQAADGRLVQQARRLHQSALSSGAFAGHGPVFRPAAGRYGDASDEQVQDRLHEQGYSGEYPGGRANAARLRLSDAQTRMENRHKRRVSIDADTGDVYTTDPHTFRRQKVDHVDLSNRPTSRVVLRDAETSPAGNTINLSNIDTVDVEDNDLYWRLDAEGWPEG